MSEQNNNRREFMTHSALAATGAALLTGGVHAGGSEIIKVGVIGCGGRGSGAAGNILDADSKVEITALGDVFQSQAEGAAQRLGRKYGERVKASKGKGIFSGLDAYKQVLDTDIDLVILATPPGFRPYHIEAAIEAKKNIFTEKPVAVDVTGIRKCLELVKKSKDAGIGIVAGTQRRHQTGYIETIKRIKDGAIGDVTSARAYWNGNGIWFRGRQPGMSDTHYQIHNWYHFLWTCGDHIVEQHVHNLDVINWVLGAHPISASGMGGRSNRPVGDPNSVGHIFDHFSVEYEYPNNVFVQSFCRQIEGTTSSVSEAVVGTKGISQVNGYNINGKRVFEGKEINPYVQEHMDLIASIREGKPLNELEQVTISTMTAILGRMSTYAGIRLTWKDVMEKAKEDTFPAKIDLTAPLPVTPVPVVGKTRFF
ncbi:MAG: Gfo/Idh/MocA family oxidoreductase [Zavarzinella sp.]